MDRGKGGRARLKIWLVMTSKRRWRRGEEGEKMERKKMRRSRN